MHEMHTVCNNKSEGELEGLNHPKRNSGEGPENTILIIVLMRFPDARYFTSPNFNTNITYFNVNLIIIKIIK